MTTPHDTRTQTTAAGTESQTLSNAPTKQLSAFSAIAIIVGIVIGAGIFKTPSMVAGVTGDAGWLIVAWVLGGVISLAGALCYAELATTYPHAGGDYHFLARAFGKPASFLYAWAKATVINTGSIALLAFVFGDYMSKVIDLGAHSTALWAIGIVVAMTLINLIGLHAASWVQTCLTMIEVTGLLCVVVAGFVLSGEAPASPALFSSSPSLGMFGLSMVFVLLTYGGWNEAAYISAEVRGGKRAIVPVIVISIMLLTLIYLLFNIAVLAGLGLSGLAGSKAVAADLMGKAFGPWGEKALGVFVAVSALTSINATMIVGARTNYALGRDWPALRFMGNWHAGRGSPVAAYCVQSLLSLALVGLGIWQTDGFEVMVEFTAPVFWAFLFLVGVSLFVLRVKDPEVERPFKVPLYPLTPVLFCLTCAFLTYSSVTYAMSKGAVYISLLVMAVGVVALVITHLSNKRA
ncbi:MAG: amino acid permease [Alcaligenaceae bacterium]|nr:MAG: amino acid permease [Alcaligenaceae bacterium]